MSQGSVRFLVPVGHCGLTLRELGERVGADYPAVSKAILRVRARLQKDREMGAMLKGLEHELSKVQT